MSDTSARVIVGAAVVAVVIASVLVLWMSGFFRANAAEVTRAHLEAWSQGDCEQLATSSAYPWTDADISDCLADYARNEEDGTTFDLVIASVEETDTSTWHDVGSLDGNQQLLRVEGQSRSTIDGTDICDDVVIEVIAVREAGQWLVESWDVTDIESVDC